LIGVSLGTTRVQEVCGPPRHTMKVTPGICGPRADGDTGPCLLDATLPRIVEIVRQPIDGHRQQ